MKLIRTSHYVSIIFLCGCSSTPVVKRPQYVLEQEGEMRVSVKTGGREINDFENRLVHHIDLSAGDIAQVSKSLLAVQAQDAVDHSGKRYGVKMNEVPQSPLGLKPRDVLTAVGKKSSPSIRDLEGMLQTLQTEGEGSVTFDRDGRPHKLILSFRKGGS